MLLIITQTNSTNTFYSHYYSCCSSTSLQYFIPHCLTFQRLDMLWQPAISSSHSWDMIWGPIHSPLKASEPGEISAENERPLHHCSTQTCLDSVKRANKRTLSLLWLYRMIMMTWQPAVKQIWKITQGLLKPGRSQFFFLSCNTLKCRETYYLTVSLQHRSTYTLFTFLTLHGMMVIDWQVWAVTMGTRMEVAQLESRMNIDDYRKLQSLFLVSLCLFFPFFVY